MLWQIWIKPNQIIEEEYPASWSVRDVTKAAKGRYGADKIQNVAPASIGGSYDDDDNNQSSYSGGGFSLPGWNTFKYLVAGFFLLMVLSNVGQNEEMSNPTPTTDTVELKSFMDGYKP